MKLWLIADNTLSNHRSVMVEAALALKAISLEMACLGEWRWTIGYLNIAALKLQGTNLYIATGREPHHIRNNPGCLSLRLLPATGAICGPGKPD